MSYLLAFVGLYYSRVGYSKLCEANHIQTAGKRVAVNVQVHKKVTIYNRAHLESLTKTAENAAVMSCRILKMVVFTDIATSHQVVKIYYAIINLQVLHPDSDPLYPERQRHTFGATQSPRSPQKEFPIHSAEAKDLFKVTMLFTK